MESTLDDDGSGNPAQLTFKLAMTVKGDRITLGLRMQLSQAGFTRGETAEGNGEALSTYSDNLVINELGGNVGVESENTIDAQRVQFELRDEARDGLRDWWAKRMSVNARRTLNRVNSENLLAA